VLEPRLEDDAARAGHSTQRLLRVRYEVDDHLVELMGVSPYHRQIIGRVQHDLDVAEA